MVKTKATLLLLLLGCHATNAPKAAPESSASQPALPELRVLVVAGDDALPRPGSSGDLDRESAELLAAKYGMVARFVTVSSAEEILPALHAGLGDIAPATLVAAKDPSLAYSAPVRDTEAAIVVKKGSVPKDVAHFAWQTVYATRAPELGAAVEHWASKLGQKVALEETSGDDDELFSKVARGELPAAVALSEEVERYRAYRDDIEVAVTIGKLPVVWAAVAEKKNLIESAPAALYEQALTAHKRMTYTADLDEILKRRVIRVAMLNNSVAYFLYRGQELGFQYELALMLAQKLGVRLEVVVPDRPADAARLLAEGKADVMASSLGPDEDEEAGSVSYSQPFIYADQVVVQPARQKPFARVEDLAGQEIHVRKSSAYFRTLQALQAKVPTLKIVAADESAETEDLIDQVGRGEVPLTVSNSLLLEVERTYRDDIQGGLVIAEHQPLRYGVRADAKKLLSWLDRFVKQEYKSTAYNLLYRKYFKDEKKIRQRERAFLNAGISPYDALVQKLSTRYGFDWRLVTAQMFQESHFDPSAKSWVGALGLLQVMPKTATQLGFRDLQEPANGLHAGIKYLHQLLEQIDRHIDMRQRVRMALAAYNVGIGHVKDARKLARERGLDPNRWFDNVEKAMLLLEKKQFYQRAAHGFCRGREPVNYVSAIQTKYDAYIAIAPSASGHLDDGDFALLLPEARIEDEQRAALVAAEQDGPRPPLSAY